MNFSHDCLRASSLSEYQGIEFIGDNSFQLKYIDKEKAFNYFFEALKRCWCDFLRSVNEDHHQKNIRNHADCAFAHFVALEVFPDSYELEAEKKVIDIPYLTMMGMFDDIEAAQKPFKFDEFYLEVICAITDLSLNSEVMEFLDVSDLMNSYQKAPLSEHPTIFSIWEGTYLDELKLCVCAVFIAISRAVSKLYAEKKI
ncbi:hypothetical protein QX249_13370 [Vibrio parahaemolyticus]|uniref:Uncharacterized protein n=1 Tax=Vibrio parahaemolyticus TaxID=670 RepID=A0AAW8PZF9_VIBPH|nr:hypothetical protein [Vibrio parahaemolyticus]MDS1821658.1 hypothetical protein [Vibrio parahaemolyticus]